MESASRPSIRKHLLDQVYHRNLNPFNIEDSSKKESISYEFNSIHSNLFMSQDSIPIQEAPKQTKTFFHKRSKTPNVVPAKPVTLTFQIFEEFLSDLQTSREKLPKTLLSRSNLISKALSEHFTRNPSFSMDFYLSMTGILKYIQEPDDVNPSILNKKIEEALIHLPKTEGSKQGSFKTCIEKLNLKLINTLKRTLCTNETICNLFNSFLVLFTEADKTYEKIQLKKMQPAKTCQIMQKVLQTPGKMIQTCRKFEELIESGQIIEQQVKFIEGLLKSVQDAELDKLDSTGGLKIFKEFLNSCVQVFHYDSNFMSQISLMRNSSQDNLQLQDSTEKYSKLDEALELSKELLNKSPKNSTPLKEQHKKMMKKIVKGQLEKFLSGMDEGVAGDPVRRIMAYEKFERSVLDQVRKVLLVKSAGQQKFSEEFFN